MTNTIAGITALLKTKLEALEDGSGNVLFITVSDNSSVDFTGYPSAIVYSPDGGDQTIDTHRVETTYNFIIKIYQEYSEVGKTNVQAESIMVSVLDRVLTAMRQDTDLSGEVSIMKIINWQKADLTNKGRRLYATVNLDIKVVVPNYSS